MKTCPDCNGDGVIDQGTDDEQRCPTCGGLGVVPDNDDDAAEVIRTNLPALAASRISFSPFATISRCSFFGSDATSAAADTETSALTTSGAPSLRTSTAR